MAFRIDVAMGNALVGLILLLVNKLYFEVAFLDAIALVQVSFGLLRGFLEFTAMNAKVVASLKGLGPTVGDIVWALDPSASSEFGVAFRRFARETWEKHRGGALPIVQGYDQTIVAHPLTAEDNFGIPDAPEPYHWEWYRFRFLSQWTYRFDPSDQGSHLPGQFVDNILVTSLDLYWSLVRYLDPTVKAFFPVPPQILSARPLVQRMLRPWEGHEGEVGGEEDREPLGFLHPVGRKGDGIQVRARKVRRRGRRGREAWIPLDRIKTDSAVERKELVRRVCSRRYNDIEESGLLDDVIKSSILQLYAPRDGEMLDGNGEALSWAERENMRITPSSERDKEHEWLFSLEFDYIMPTFMKRRDENGHWKSQWDQEQYLVPFDRVHTVKKIRFVSASPKIIELPKGLTPSRHIQIAQTKEIPGLQEEDRRDLQERDDMIPEDATAWTVTTVGEEPWWVPNDFVEFYWLDREEE